MRYAILSDIHANLEALEAVLGEIEHLGVDRVFCLGDVVGYNADPNACVRLLMEKGIPSLMGNHDAAACGLEEPDAFNPVARAAVLWTRGALHEECRRFLRNQPLRIELPGGICMVHGSLLHRDHYLMARSDVMMNLDRMGAADPPIRLLFFGHTHVQAAFDDAALPCGPPPAELVLERARRYLVNPGSVGQPRDGNPSAAFLVYDDEIDTVRFARCSYDLRSCADKILSAGLPERLAARLYSGC